MTQAPSARPRARAPACCAAPALAPPHPGPPPAHILAAAGLRCALDVSCSARVARLSREQAYTPHAPQISPRPAPLRPPPSITPSAAAHLKVKYHLAAAALLLAFCVAMLGANAGLTYHVVKMSQETRLESSGKLTDRSGSRVVGEWAAGCGAEACWGCWVRRGGLLGLLGAALAASVLLMVVVTSSPDPPLRAPAPPPFPLLQAPRNLRV